MAVLVDGSGWVFIADTGNHVIRLVNPSGVITTYAGQYYATGATAPAVCTVGNTVTGYSAYYNSVGDGCFSHPDSA